MSEHTFFKYTLFVLYGLAIGILFHKFLSEQDEKHIASLKHHIAFQDALLIRKDSLIDRQQYLIDVEIENIKKRILHDSR